MTEASKPSATDTDLAAADWVQRRHLWAWTQADQIEFDTWLSETDSNRIAYIRQDAIWNTAGRLTALRRHLPMRPAASAPRPAKWTLLRSVAAATVVCAVGFMGFAYLDRPSDTTYVTPVGGHKIISLADGTRIELNTDSALRISSGAVRRVTLLRGEAYFDVYHNSRDPFAVTANGYRITDLGTKFSVRASAETVRVSLLEGSAVVAPVTGLKEHRSALLMPGDVAIASPSKLTVEKEPMASVASSLGWRRGVLIFKDTELADAAAEFNRYNTRKIRLGDPAVARLKINGTFQAENAELFASSVQDLFGLRAIKSENDTTLSR